MARARTLGDLRDDVRARCMIESEEDLFPTLMLNRWINESWQDLRLELSNDDIEYYMTPATGTLTVGVVTGTAHGSLPLPPDAFAVYGLDLVVSGEVISVDPMTFQQRNDGQCGTTKTGVPAGYHITSVGQENADDVDDGTIILSPAPDAAYAYRLWYLPAWEDLVDDEDVFNGIAGCEQWVIWDVCVKVAMRIDDSKKQEAMATRERALSMARIVKTIKRMQRGGATQRRDSRASRA